MPQACSVITARTDKQSVIAPQADGRRRPKTSATCILILAFLPVLIFIDGCIRTRGVPGCGPPADFCTGPDLANVRIEISSQPALRQSGTLWVSASAPNGVTTDKLAVRWDTYVLHATNKGKNCELDLCDPRTGACNGAVLVINENIAPTVQACEAFMQCDHPVKVTTSQGNFDAGCPSSPKPLEFTATSNTNYQVLEPSIGSHLGVIAEKKVFVVDSTPQLATYQLTPYAVVDRNHPDIKWFKWSTGGSTIWDENFSGNLQVSKIRLLRGRPRQDPITGMVMLEDAVVVRPSSIILVPAFIEGNSVIGQNRIRCYADTTPDGNIDLTACRGSASSATPAYLKAQATDRLTWVAEFNPNETQTQGATAPTLNGDALVIEFMVTQN